MVNIHVNDNNNQIRINVPGINNTVTTESSNPNNNVSSTIGNETFYNGLAKEWAISPNLVQGIDYSSKYYAGQSANSASEAASAVEGFTTTVTEATQQAISTLETTKTTIITELGEEKTSIISDINSEGSTQVTSVTSTAETYITSITETGSTQISDITSTGESYLTSIKETSSTQITSITSTGESYLTEIETLGTTQISDITSTATTCITDIQSEGSTQVTSVTTTGETYITNIQTEGSTQVTNITTTATSYITTMTTLKDDAQGYATAAGLSATAAATSEDNAEIWAEGTDAEVQALGGVHSAKGWAQESATGQINANWAESDPTSKAYIFNKPTKLSDFTNDTSFISGITSGDVITALGYTPYNATNPNNYITASALTPYALSADLASVATSGSYNDLSNKPTIPDTSNLANKDLSNLSSTGNAKFQAPLVSGTNIKTINNNSILGSGDLTLDGLPSQTGKNGKFLKTDGTDAFWEDIPSVEIDGVTITENSSDELQTVGVIDQNNTSNAIKTWTGTKAQYDAIVTKDSNTLYNIIDDTDVTFQLLELIYPIGSIYIGTMSVCPLQVLGVGTWQLVASDRVLQGAGTRGSVGDTLNESLPNATITIKTETVTAGSGTAYLSASSESRWKANQGSTASYQDAINFSLNKASSTYQDNAPVQQDAYLVNIWERIS